MQAAESQFWGLEIFGIFPLTNPLTGQFAKNQFELYPKGHPQAGQPKVRFSDPNRIGELLKGAKASQYIELKPKDVSKMMLGPENCDFMNGKKGFSRVFVDPHSPNDPNKAVILYFSFGKKRSDGKTTLKLENAISGPDANVVMAYKMPCCKEISVLLDAKKSAEQRDFEIRDGHQGTHEGEKGMFYHRDNNEKIIVVGGKPLPLVTRTWTEEDFELNKANKSAVAAAIKMGKEFGHRLMHARDVPHHCHDFVKKPKRSGLLSFLRP